MSQIRRPIVNRDGRDADNYHDRPEQGLRGYTMKHDDMIAGMCLYGFIRRETPGERKRCLDEIENAFGKSIAMIVRGLLKNNGPGLTP